MKKTILIMAVMFFAFSVAASAQALFQVGSTPVTAVASCGATELTGDIAFTTVAGSPAIAAGTITVNYGVPVVPTSGATWAIYDATGATIVAPTPIAISSFPLSNQFTISVPAVTTGTAPYTIRITGVRVNVAGSGLTSLSASVSSTVNLFVGGQTNIVVISSIKSAIDSIETFSDPFFLVNTALTGSNAINAAAPSVSTITAKTVSLDVNEGFVNAFVQNSVIGVTFSPIPAGLSLTLPATITAMNPATNPPSSTGQVFQAVDTDTLTPIAGPVLTSASTSLTVFYKLVTATATGALVQETVTIPISVNTVLGAPSPLPLGTVSATVDMFPKLNAFFPNWSIIPQYSGTSCQKGPVNILEVVTGNTMLMIPYAVSAVGYDTGIAIANTTKDPLTGRASAVPQNSTIVFTFFPQAKGGVVPDSFKYTTSATSPGAGLIDGSLNAGSLYTVLLSQLLTAAGKAGDFSGYITAEIKATNCHGQYFISDFEAFTNGALMLVVDTGARRTAPEKLMH